MLPLIVKHLWLGIEMKRKYPERPIVGVGAVIFIKESVLLARRDNDPGKGKCS